MVSSIAEQFADNNVTISKWLADLDEKNSLGYMWFIKFLYFMCASDSNTADETKKSFTSKLMISLRFGEQVYKFKNLENF